MGLYIRGVVLTGCLLAVIGVFAQDDGTGIHKVVKGETLFTIAKMYSMTVEELQQVNQLQGTTIFVGDELRVRGQASRDLGTSRGMSPEASRLRQGEVVADLGVLRDDQRAPIRYATAADAAAAVRGTVEEKKQFHLVKEGEDLFSIADEYEVSVSDLKTWNKIAYASSGDVIIVKKWYEKVSPSAPSLVGKQALPSDVSPGSQATIVTQGVSRGAARPQAGAAPSARPGSNDIWTQQDISEILNRLDGNSVAGPITRGDARSRIIPAAEYERENNAGTYVAIDLGEATGRRFYAAHKTLPLGAQVRVVLPEGKGYVNVVVMSRLPDNSSAIIGLSPACVRLLKEAGNPRQISILYK